MQEGNDQSSRPPGLLTTPQWSVSPDMRLEVPPHVSVMKKERIGSSHTRRENGEKGVTMRAT